MCVDVCVYNTSAASCVRCAGRATQCMCSVHLWMVVAPPFTLLLLCWTPHNQPAPVAALAEWLAVTGHFNYTFGSHLCIACFIVACCSGSGALLLQVGKLCCAAWARQQRTLQKYDSIGCWIHQDCSTVWVSGLCLETCGVCWCCLRCGVAHVARS
jgi:hypothetical protein